jgi:hypothetical protein
VGDEDHPGAAFDKVLDGWDRLADPGVVDDPAVLDRNVEVDADQDPLTGDVDLADGGFL